MRRALFVSVAVALTTLPVLSQSAVNVGGMIYEIVTTSGSSGDSYAKLVGTQTGSDAMESLTIPVYVTAGDKEYAVREIADGVFKDYTTLKSVDIPDGVTTIGQMAFSGCSGLSSLTCPASVTKIKAGAFAGCSDLGQLVFEAGESMLAVASDAFSGSGVTSVDLRRTLSDESTGVWSQLPVKSVTVAANVTSLPANSFTECAALNSVTLSEGLESIGDAAFRSCSNITELSIPSTVKRLGDRALSGLGVTTFDGGSGVETYGVGCMSNNVNLKSFAFAEATVTLSSNIFSGCTSLKSIDVPNSVRVIGSSAFAGCTSLTAISLPASVEELGQSAFDGCTSLTTVNIPGKVKYIMPYTFRDCPVTDLSLDDCDSQSLYIASNWVSLTTDKDGTIVYGKLDGLKKLYLGRYISFSQSSDPFNGGTLTPFRNSQHLETVTFGPGVVRLSEGYFEGCTALKKAEMPSTLRFIYSKTFKDCTALEQVTLPSTVTAVPSECFAGCTSLKQIYLSPSVTSIEDKAFDGARLDDLYVMSTNPPAADKSVFDDAIYAATVLHVPASSLSAYESSLPWIYFNNVKGADFSGIGVVDVDTDATDSAEPVYYFDLNGVRVASPREGQALIRVQGSKAVKIVY